MNSKIYFDNNLPRQQPRHWQWQACSRLFQGNKIVGSWKAGITLPTRVIKL